jgi:hypothetical protein
MIVGIMIITRLFDFDVPKREILVILFFFRRKRAIRAPINTPLPSRIIVVSM